MERVDGMVLVGLKKFQITRTAPECRSLEVQNASSAPARRTNRVYFPRQREVLKAAYNVMSTLWNYNMRAFLKWQKKSNNRYCVLCKIRIRKFEFWWVFDLCYFGNRICGTFRNFSVARSFHCSFAYKAGKNLNSFQLRKQLTFTGSLL